MLSTVPFPTLNAVTSLIVLVIHRSPLPPSPGSTCRDTGVLLYLHLFDVDELCQSPVCASIWMQRDKIPDLDVELCDRIVLICIRE